ncbi:hypothetical protein ACE0DR_24840 [Azotobacter sp. CWF10]
MNAVEHGADTPEALQSVLDDWYKRTRQMLRFHLRHPDRSLLLDSRDVLEQPNAYLDALNQRWQLPLEAAESEQSWRNTPTARRSICSTNSCSTGLKRSPCTMKYKPVSF